MNEGTLGGQGNNPSLTPSIVASCDVDGNGVLDSIVSNFDGNTISVFYGSVTNGVYSSTQQVFFGIASGPFGVGCGDFNRDGKNDIVFNNDGPTLTLREAVFLINKGPQGAGISTTFETAQVFQIGTNPSEIVVTDFNNDNFPDVAITNTNDGSVSVLINTMTINSTIANFNQAVYAAGSQVYGITAADFNLDGWTDFAVTIRGGNTVMLFTNNKDPLAVAENRFVSKSFTVQLNPYSLASGDLNDDDRPDLVVAIHYSQIPSSIVGSISTNTVNVLLNTGNETFSSYIPVVVGQYPTGVVVADFDADGWNDVAVTNSGSHSMGILLNAQTDPLRYLLFYKVFVVNGSFSSFQPMFSYAAACGPFGIASGDYNDDSLIDITVTNSKTGTTSFFAGTTNEQIPSAASYCNDSGLSTGDIIAITILCLIIFAIVLFVALFLWLKFCRPKPQGKKFEFVYFSYF